MIVFFCDSINSNTGWSSYLHSIYKCLNNKKKIIIMNKNSNKNFENYKIIPSIKRAKLLLKWDPKINLEDGIKKTIQYIKR